MSGKLDHWRKERLFLIELNKIVNYVEKNEIGRRYNFTYIRIQVGKKNI